MNIKTVFILTLSLGLFWSCDKKKEDPLPPHIEKPSSGGFTLEAEANAKDLGLDDKSRAAIQLVLKDDLNMYLFNKNKSQFITHAFFRNRLDKDILGYARIEWEIRGYDSEDNSLKLRYWNPKLDVEAIGKDYVEGQTKYLDIKANAPSETPGYWVWYIAGVMGGEDSWVDKKTGRVYFRPTESTSNGSTKEVEVIEPVFKEDGKTFDTDKEGNVKTVKVRREVSAPVNAPLVSPFVRISPVQDGNGHYTASGKIFNWRFLARGIMLRLNLSNNAAFDLDNAEIKVHSTDNSLVGGAWIGFGSTDVPSVNNTTSTPKILCGSELPSIRVSQAKGKKDVSHMVWAISSNPNGQTPKGVTLSLTPPGRPQRDLGRRRAPGNNTFNKYKSLDKIQNNSSYFLDLECI